MFSDFQYTVLMEIQKLGQTQECILKSIRDMERDVGHEKEDILEDETLQVNTWGVRQGRGGSQAD